MKALLITPLLLGALLACSPASRHVREIPDPNLPYLAMIRADRAESSVVVYNPDLCREIGAACGFFLSQAYAHAALNHALLPPFSYPERLEAEADCYAARYADPEEVQAAVRLLSEAGPRGAGIPTSGEARARARRIRDCAIAAENWSGNE